MSDLEKRMREVEGDIRAIEARLNNGIGERLAAVDKRMWGLLLAQLIQIIGFAAGVVLILVEKVI